MELGLVALEYTDLTEHVFANERQIDVYCWRMEQLIRAGYNAILASRLADNVQVDLHTACTLLERGCDERTADLILS